MEDRKEKNENARASSQETRLSTFWKESCLIMILVIILVKLLVANQCVPIEQYQMMITRYTACDNDDDDDDEI